MRRRHILLRRWLFPSLPRCLPPRKRAGDLVFTQNTQMRESQTCSTPSVVDLQNFHPSLTENKPFNYGKTRAERIPAKENPSLLLGIFCSPGSSCLSSQPSCFKIYVRRVLYSTHRHGRTHTRTHTQSSCQSLTQACSDAQNEQSLIQPPLSEANGAVFKTAFEHQNYWSDRSFVVTQAPFIRRRKVKKERWPTTKLACNKLPLNVSVLAHLLLNGLLESLTDTQTARVSSTWHTRICIQQLHINTHYIPMTSPDLQKIYRIMICVFDLCLSCRFTWLIQNHSTV